MNPRPDAMTVPDQKRRLRREALDRRRRAARAAGPGFGKLIRDHVLSSLEQLGIAEDGRTVSGYWPLQDEADVGPLLGALDERGFACALPVVVGPGKPLLFRRWTPGTALETVGFGLSQPGPEAPEVEPSLLLVPLVAFDDQGNRLGHGAGYYDRTLAVLRRRRPTYALGIAFAAQRFAVLPAEPLDERLNAVVTEKGITQFMNPDRFP